MPGLNDILQLLQGGALEPQQALEMHWANQAARKERRQAQQAGQMESLDSLATYLGGMYEPSSLDQAMQTFGGLESIRSGQVGSGLDALASMPFGGESERPAPVLDPTDVHAIAADIRRWQQEGMPSNEIRRTLHSRFANDPELTYNNDVASDLDFTIQRILGG